MAHILANMVKQTSTSTGPTTLALTGAAINPYRSFSSAMSEGDTTELMAVSRGTGAWQAAVYRYAGGVLTLVADHWLASSTGSPVAFLPGLKDVYITPLAERGKPLQRAASFAAISRFRYDVDTTSGAVTATLPASPDEGDEFQFNDAASAWVTNHFLVDPNGAEFEDAGDGSDPGDPMICVDPVKFTLVFSGGKYRPR